MDWSRKVDTAPHSAPTILKVIEIIRARRDRDGFPVKKGFARGCGGAAGDA